MNKKALVVILALLAFFVSTLALEAQTTLKENQYIKRSTELKAMASRAFDDGDYDAAAEYAAEAAEYARLSDHYVEKTLAMNAAERSLLTAKTRLTWIEGRGAKAAYPELFGKAKDELDIAQASYKREEYGEAKVQAETVLVSINLINVIDAEEAMKKANEAKSLAESRLTSDAYPALYNKGKSELNAADSAYSKAQYAASADSARTATKTFGQMFTAEAEAAIAAAKGDMARSEGRGWDKSYPEPFAKAKGELDAANASYRKAEYPAATDQARAASASFKAMGSGEAADAIAAAKASLAAAEKRGTTAAYPELSDKAKAQLASAEDSYARSIFENATGEARAASATVLSMSRSEAESAMAAAKDSLAAVEARGTAAAYPELLGEAKGQLASADASFGAAAYPNATDEARKASITVETMYRSEAYDAISAAKDDLAAAEARRTTLGFPLPYAKAKEQISSADASYASAKYPAATDDARAASQTIADMSKAEAEAAMGVAKWKLNWADSVNARKRFGAEVAAAEGEYAAAQASFGGALYGEATDHARAVLAALANVTDQEPWPAVYVVRLIPERRDCLWRIAEYTFIYNDPLRWPVIYEANKKTFKDPNNPNLIFPGQKLTIPVINNEERSGTYDPSKTYEVFPKVPR